MTTTSTKIRTAQYQEGAPIIHPLTIFSSSSSSPEPPSTTETKRSLPTSDAESEDDTSPTSPSKKAKTTTTPSLKKPNIAEENALLLELKDGKNMKWPEIADAFREHGWAGRKTGLLKNRYRSMKEGTVFWEDDDASLDLSSLSPFKCFETEIKGLVDIMYQAIFQVEREFERTKWDGISEKMVKLGASRKFTGAACEKKFRAKADGKKKTLGEQESLGEASGD